MSAKTEAPTPGKGRSTLPIAALFAAMAPVVAGIYQQSEDARQQQSQRREAFQLRQQQEAKKYEDADIASAAALQAQLAEPRVETAQFCNRVFFAASQLSAQPVATRTRSVLFAALRMRDSEGQRLLICQCGSGMSGNAAWLADLWPMITPDNVSGLDRLNQAVREAVGLCEAPVTRTVVRRSAPALPAYGSRRPEIPALVESTAAAPVPPTFENLAEMSAQTSSAAAPVESAVSSAPVQESTAASCPIDDPGDTRRIRVFIQIPDANARPEALRFRDALNAQSPYSAPPIQVVGAARSPRQAQVRYSYAMDQTAAERVSEALKRCTGLQVARPPVRLQGMSTRVDTGVLEVWWPSSQRPTAASAGQPTSVSP